MASSGNNQSMSAELFQASKEGHEDAVRRLIQSGVDINTVECWDGYTALHLASMHGHKDVVHLLLQNGANVQAVDGFICQTALHYASRSGQKDVINLLLENGANIHAVDWVGETALHLASMHGHKDVVNLLLQNGANVHAVDVGGYTALHCACMEGHVDTVNLLFHAGAGVHDVDKNGRTALDLAISGGHHDVVNVLLDYLDKVNVQSQKKAIVQQTAGATAAEAGNLKEDKLEDTNVSNQQSIKLQASCSEPVAIGMPPVERDDGIGVPTQRVGHVSLGQVPEADLKTLRYFHVRIKRDLRPFPLIDHLYVKEIIDADELEIITITEKHNGRAASVAKMLDILRLSRRDAFQIFLECLELEDVGYAVLASELREHRYGGAQP